MRDSKPMVQSTLNAFLHPERRRKSAETSSPYFNRPQSNDEPTAAVPRPDRKRSRLSLDDAPARSGTYRMFESKQRPQNQEKPIPNPRTQNKELALIALETKTLLPNLLPTVPHAPADGHLFQPERVPHLDSRFNPGNVPTKVRVVNADTLDAALSLASSSLFVDPLPVCILNMANAYHGGGGWLKGAMAQEEAICYRSSLSFTLKNRFYPIPDRGGIYSPSVVVVRKNVDAGHGLLDLSKPDELPVVSVVSVAAIRDPQVEDAGGGMLRYKMAKDREIMMGKMRVVLRIAAYNRHRKIVLGALGCGAFNNPNEEVAACWKEVLQESEFAGGWWEDIVFAVLDDGGGVNGSGNFGVFHRALDGMSV